MESQKSVMILPHGSAESGSPTSELAVTPVANTYDSVRPQSLRPPEDKPTMATMIR